MAISFPPHCGNCNIRDSGLIFYFYFLTMPIANASTYSREIHCNEWRFFCVFFFSQRRVGKVQNIFLLWSLVSQVHLPAFCGALWAPVMVADENWWMVSVRLRGVLGLINMCTDARAAGKDVFLSQVDWNLVLFQFVFTKYAWKQIFFCGRGDLKVWVSYDFT